MEFSHAVKCGENEGVVAHLLRKKLEMGDNGALSENLELTLNNALRGIAACKNPIKTLKDLFRIKGVGKWIVRLMKDFFEEDPPEDPVEIPVRGRNPPKVPKRYVPRKNSVAYALLITLHRESANGRSFMRKQDLIDAAEASGLSRTSIAPEKGMGKPGQFGSSPKDWYTGWSCMKTLISKGLVAKSSCPAKYMLTDEGQVTARDCLARSGIDASVEHHGFATNGYQVESDVVSDSPISSSGNQKGSQFVVSDSESEEIAGNGKDFQRSVAVLKSCTTFDDQASIPSASSGVEGGINEVDIATPPREVGGGFADTYDVILVLDDRENFGCRWRKVYDILSSQFNVSVEIRRLPVGDGIWVARHRRLHSEYVLDFIVERKRVDDLHHSIRDNRYRDQKLRLSRCGLQKLIYLVEGDPNGCEGAESVKTACFTTEILEGFDVQRTSGFTETIRRYGFLTKAICEVYGKQFLEVKSGEGRGRVCPSFEEFVKRCQDLEKLTISDVFSLQLMQVPQVTEEVAMAVVKLYPTLVSLARAYALLEGDATAQEEMLKRKSNAIGGSASRNIFKLVWGS